MFQNFDPNQNYYSFNDKNTVPLVFIHGVGLDQRMWEPQIEAFKEYSIITYDLLGHGKTILNKDAVTLDDAEYVIQRHVYTRSQGRDLINRPYFRKEAIR